jgi:hypothetical protein
MGCVQRRARSLIPGAFFMVGSIMFQMQWNAALPAQKAETNYYFAGMTTVRRPARAAPVARCCRGHVPPRTPQ